MFSASCTRPHGLALVAGLLLLAVGSVQAQPVEDPPEAAQADEAPAPGGAAEGEPEPSDPGQSVGTGDEASGVDTQAEPAQSDADPPQPPELEPPRLLSSPPPTYPESRRQGGEHPTVVVTVTLDDHGRVVGEEIEQPGDPEFDAAATQALRRWEFAPALRRGEPIPSRIRVAVHFELPTFELPTAATVATPPEVEEEEVAGEEVLQDTDAVVPPTFSAHGQAELESLRDDDRAASDVTLQRDILDAAPHMEGADKLRVAPGLFLARPEGEAVAHRMVLRGFDSDHGQDIELKVGGVPMNLPSHIHGQGYADLGLLIAEVVDEVHATEGVYDPRQGDFAVAGTIDTELGVQQRGITSKSKYGSYGTFQQLLMWAPEEQKRGTFGAVRYRQSNGFGDNRRGRSVSAILQADLRNGPWRTRVTGIAYGAAADMAGVLRRDDIAAGDVDFYDVYPYPTARAQHAASQRFVASVRSERRGESGDDLELKLWTSVDRFRLQENFTGFIQRSQALADVAGRGDLIEQQNRTLTLGLEGRYLTAPYTPTEWLHASVELGVMGRMDGIEQSQNLLDASVRNQTWDQRVDTSIRALDIGFWGEVDAHLGDRVQLRAGIRADVLQYEVDDRLGNFVPVVRPPGTFIEGFRRTAAGVVWGPRTSIEVQAHRLLALMAAYGEGFRTPQARTLEDGEEAPFTKVRSADVGFRLQDDEYWSARASGFWTQLSDDVAFDAEEGRLERVGESRRLGVMLYGEVRPLPWIRGAASFTYVDAQLLEPPPPTAEDPTPAFKAGQSLPFVPPVVVRLDLGASGPLRVDRGNGAISGQAGIGYSYLSPRPLPYGDFATPVSLLDASASIAWRMFRFGVEAYNLLDNRYAASEFNFASSWSPGDVRSRTPVRHIAAGAPRTILGTLEISL